MRPEGASGSALPQGRGMKDLIERFVQAAVSALQERTGLTATAGRVQAVDALGPGLDEAVTVPVSGNLHGRVVLDLSRDATANLASAIFESDTVAFDRRGLLAEVGSVVAGRVLDASTLLGIAGSIGFPAVSDGPRMAEGRSAAPIHVFEGQLPGGAFQLAFALEIADSRPLERRPERIFVVDHSVFSRRQLGQILERHGFELDDAAKDAESALASYPRFKSQFVLVDLLDLGMPEVQFFDAMFKVHPDAIVFVVSSVRPPQQTLDELKSRGVRDFLSKPIDEKDLVRRIHEAGVHRFQVELENDALEAWLTVGPARARKSWPTVEDLREALRRRGVVEGYDLDALERIATVRVAAERVLVARGVDAGRGAPAQIELYFDDKTHFGHMMKEEGAETTLYESVRLIRRLAPGEPIAQKFSEPTQGTPGRTVTGREIPGRPGWDPIVPRPGVEVGEGGRRLYATEKGAARLEGEDLYLEPLLEIPRSVTRATGDVNFHGSVLVWGDVSGGATVTATGDVEVKGDLEAGLIRAGRNVLVGRVIGKKGIGSVAALGHVGCRYVQGASISCFGDLYVLGFANQIEAVAGGSFVLLGDQPTLAGGKVYAGDVVDVGDLGSGRAHETIVELCSETFYERLDDAYSLLRTAFRENPPAAIKKQILGDRAFAHRMEAIRTRMTALREALGSIWKKGEAENHIRVRGRAHPGTLVRIGRRFLDLDETHSSVRFFLRGMSIGISEFSKLNVSPTKGGSSGASEARGGVVESS